METLEERYVEETEESAKNAKLYKSNHQHLRKQNQHQNSKISWIAEGVNILRDYSRDRSERIV